jgi:hypothetical protein
MRTTDFSQVLFDALQYSGNDRHNITDETFAQFRDFAHSRLREAWESNQWSDVCRIVDFTTSQDASGTNYFVPSDDASEILGVWNKNPQDTSRAKQLDYQIYNEGSEIRIILPSIILTGSYLYRQNCPQLTGDPYDPTVVYYRGSQIYFDSGSGTGSTTPLQGKPHSGNFYTCTVNSTTVGDNPNNHPESWVKIDIPYIFGMFMAWGSAANWYVSETMLQEATIVESKATQVLEQEYDKFLRQQGQFGRINMNRTY